MSSELTRRTFVKGAAAAAAVAGLSALTGCSNAGDTGSASSSASASAAEEQPAYVINDEVEDLICANLGKDIKIACIIIAAQEGLYEEEKLNVTFETVANLSDAITAVSENKLDILPFGIIPTCTFVGQGVENVMVFGGTIAEGSECVVLPENKDKFVKVEDFTDKKIAYFPMETGHLVMQGLQQEIGTYNPENWIIMSSQQAIIEAVRKGECDAGFLNSGQGYVAMQSGLATSMHVGDLKADFPCCRQSTSMESFSNKSSALIKFTIANLRAYEILCTDKKRSIAALAAYSGQPNEFVENVIYSTSSYTTPMVIEMDPYTDAVCEFYETMKATENIPSDTPYKMEDHVDSTIYKAALDEVIKRYGENDLWTSLVELYTTHNTIGK